MVSHLSAICIKKLQFKMHSDTTQYNYTKIFNLRKLFVEE